MIPSVTYLFVPSFGEPRTRGDDPGYDDPEEEHGQ